MARSAIQLIARAHGAKGKNLKEEIDDLAAKGLILPIMKEWSHEVRELANEGTHPRPGTTGTGEKDANDVVGFLSFLMTVCTIYPNKLKTTENGRAEASTSTSKRPIRSMPLITPARRLWSHCRQIHK